MRSFFMPRAVRNTPNPVADSPEVIRAGMAHFADHCASCHANDGSGDVAMGHAMYPPAPDMRKAPTQAMTDGAYVTAEYAIKAKTGERVTDSGGLATYALVKSGGAWKIRHTHTSAKRRAPAGGLGQDHAHR